MGCLLLQKKHHLIFDKQIKTRKNLFTEESVAQERETNAYLWVHTQFQCTVQNLARLLYCECPF